MSISAPLDRLPYEECDGGMVMSALGWVLRGVVVVIGRLIGQILGARHELGGRRRDQRLDAMIAAWRGLVSGAELDRTLADIQLFGTAEQAERAARAARALEAGASGALDELLESLRAELRDELLLDPARSPIAIARVGRAPAQGVG